MARPNQAEPELDYDSGIPLRPEAAYLKSVIDTGQHRSDGAPSPTSSWERAIRKHRVQGAGQKQSHEGSERRERRAWPVSSTTHGWTGWKGHTEGASPRGVPVGAFQMSGASFSFVLLNPGHRHFWDSGGEQDPTSRLWACPRTASSSHLKGIPPQEGPHSPGRRPPSQGPTEK